MKSEKNILIAFLLNLLFSVFEVFGGVFTGSVALISDAIHDFGDAISIGLSYFCEKKSKKHADENYTFGYKRYSVLGGAITTLILIIGSVSVIYKAITRLASPVEIKYNEMILFAIIGTVVNLCAAYFTHNGTSLNQKAVNLHMIEDVLGWLVVLAGAIIMKFTNFVVIDSIITICVALYILIHSFKNLEEIINIFLEKTPCNINIEAIKTVVKSIDGVTDVHHIHIWSMDGQFNCATMHIVSNFCTQELKSTIRKILCELGIHHATLEFESESEKCLLKNCKNDDTVIIKRHHH